MRLPSITYLSAPEGLLKERGTMPAEEICTLLRNGAFDVPGKIEEPP